MRQKSGSRQKSELRNPAPKSGLKGPEIRPRRAFYSGPKSGSVGENGVRNLTNCAARQGAPFSPGTPSKTRDGDIRKRAAGIQ